MILKSSCFKALVMKIILKELPLSPRAALLSKDILCILLGTLTDFTEEF